jgi:hypothetical protein
MVKIETTVSETISYPKGAILDAWSDSEWNDGVQIDQMEELTTLAVQTSNSLYEITVLNGHTGEVLVRGGEFFPVRTPVRLGGQHVRRLDSQEARHLRGFADGDRPSAGRTFKQGGARRNDGGKGNFARSQGD